MLTSQGSADNLSQATRESLLSAHDYFRLGDIDRAKSLLDLSVRDSQLEDDIFDSCCMRASLGALEGDDNIATYLEKANGLPDSHIVRCYLEGVASIARGGSLRMAKLKFEEALRNDSSFVLAHLGLAAVYYQEKEWKPSFTEYRIVLETLGNAAPPITRVGLALCSYRLRDTEHAMKCVERALDVNPEDALALLLKIVLFIEKRNITKMAQAVQKLRAIVPKNAVVVQRVADLAFFKAVTQRRCRESAKALKLLIRSVLGHCDTTQAAYATFQEGRLCHAIGDLDEAKRLLADAFSALPQMVACPIHLAKVLYKLGEKDEAVTLLRDLDARFPAEKEVLELLCRHMADQGQHELAMDYARRLTLISPGDASSWLIASWTNRLNKAQCLTYMKHYCGLLQKSGVRPSWALRANIASLDASAPAEELTKLVAEVANTHEWLTSIAPLPIQIFPIVYNAALKLEQSNLPLARAYYCLLVKKFPQHREPYLRLHELACEAHHWQQAFEWLALMRTALPNDSLATAYEAKLFSTLGLHNAAAGVLDTAPERKNIEVALAYASIYLWGAQQRSRKATKQLHYAKNRYEWVLKKDPANILAAHGVACCVALASSPLEAHSALERVAELKANEPYVQEGIDAHLANVKVTTDACQGSIVLLEKKENKSAAQYGALTYCYAATDQFDKAIAAVEKGLQAFPNHPPLVYNSALVYFAAVLKLMCGAVYLSETDVVRVQAWLVAGLEMAKRFVSSHPSGSVFEESRAAQTFLSDAARLMYVLRDRIDSLREAGVLEARRLERDANLWKEKHAEKLAEREAQKRREREAQEAEEKRLEEKREYLRQVMLNATEMRQNPNFINDPYNSDVIFDPTVHEENLKRQREEDAARADIAGEDLEDMEKIAGLLVGGMDMGDEQR